MKGHRCASQGSASIGLRRDIDRTDAARCRRQRQSRRKRYLRSCRDRFAQRSATGDAIWRRRSGTCHPRRHWLCHQHNLLLASYYLHRDIRLVSAVRCSRHSRAHFRARLCQDTRNPAKQFPHGLAAPDPSRRRNSLRRTNGAQNASTLTKRALGSPSIYNRPAKIPCT